MVGMITYPIIANEHWLRPNTIFSRGWPHVEDEVAYFRITHLPSGQWEEFAEMDREDQQRWMEKMLILFPSDQYPGPAGETRPVDKHASSGYNDNQRQG